MALEWKWLQHLNHGLLRMESPTSDMRSPSPIRPQNKDQKQSRSFQYGTWPWRHKRLTMARVTFHLPTYQIRFSRSSKLVSIKISNKDFSTVY